MVGTTIDMFPGERTTIAPDVIARRVAALTARAQDVYTWIHTCGSTGATRADVATALGILDQSLGWIFQELQAAELIVAPGDRRRTRGHATARIFVSREALR